MDEVVVCDFVFTFDFYLTKKEPTSDNVEEELTEEEREQAEIERHFGPVDEKQQDVEQVYVISLVFLFLKIYQTNFRTGLSETYLLKQFFLLFISIFIMGFVLLHFSVLFRPNLPVSAPLEWIK